MLEYFDLTSFGVPVLESYGINFNMRKNLGQIPGQVPQVFTLLKYKLTMLYNLIAAYCA
jgi:hypothetical protein